LLREAQQRHPDDMWINTTLGSLLGELRPPRREEAIRFCSIAVALRPDNAGAQLGLSLALHGNGRSAEAVAAIQKAIELKPDNAAAYSDLGLALAHVNRLDEAIDACRRAVELEPDLWWGYLNLSQVLGRKGRLDEAIGACRKAIELKPDYAEAYDNLGAALEGKGLPDDAAEAHRKAIEIDPQLPGAHYNLANDLRAKGQLDAAIAEYREAVRISEDFAMAQCNLGITLRDNGQFSEAVAHLRRGHELGSKDPHWGYPSAEWVKECERLVDLEGKLPAILSGKEQPASAAERAEYAQVCQIKRLYAAAARLCREAIAAQPDLVASPANGIRYNAACAAALAGCGAGADAARLSDVERAGLRKQALDWLRPDLDAWRGQLDKDPDKARPAVAQTMRHWLVDPDFSAVRGAGALAKLPEAERQDWQKLWADVAATLRRAADKPPRPAGADGPEPHPVP
jgi:tetratricopeptide (TPR) repeat protein